MEIKDKNVLLTGASRGIGVYIAKSLIENGAKVVGVARSKAGLDQTAKKLGSNFIPLPFDLSQTNHLEQLIIKVKEISGRIDILVNNAGIELYKEYHHYTYAEFTAVINVNLLVPMELTRLCLPDMIAHGGHVVTIASLAGKKGVAYNTPYSASKAGLIMWMDGLRQELHNTPVGVSTICPGYIADAGMFFDGHVEPPAMLGTSQPEKVAHAVIKSIQYNCKEIIVNHGPIKPLLALGQILPNFGDKIVRMFGVNEVSKKRISK